MGHSSTQVAAKLRSPVLGLALARDENLPSVVLGTTHALTLDLSALKSAQPIPSSREVPHSSRLAMSSTYRRVVLSIESPQTARATYYLENPSLNTEKCCSSTVLSQESKPSVPRETH